MDEDKFDFEIKRPNFIIRLIRKIKIWYRMRQLAKDDPFIYENKDSE